MILAATLIVWITNAFGLPVYNADLKPAYAGVSYFKHDGSEPRIYIDKEWAYALSHFQGSLILLRYRLSVGIFVLAHELGHVRLITGSEDRADNYACNHYVGVARKLGATIRQAIELFTRVSNTPWTRGFC